MKNRISKNDDFVKLCSNGKATHLIRLSQIAAVCAHEEDAKCTVVVDGHFLVLNVPASDIIDRLENQSLVELNPVSEDIDTLNLPRRIVRILYKNNLFTTKDLTDCSELELLSLPNLGIGGVTKVMDALAKHKLHLK